MESNAANVTPNCYIGADRKIITINSTLAILLKRPLICRIIAHLPLETCLSGIAKAISGHWQVHSPCKVVE